MLVLIDTFVCVYVCVPFRHVYKISPALGEDARLDQVDDYPEWYEVDPLTLGARDYILDIRWVGWWIGWVSGLVRGLGGWVGEGGGHSVGGLEEWVGGWVGEGEWVCAWLHEWVVACMRSVSKS